MYTYIVYITYITYITYIYKYYNIYMYKSNENVGPCHGVSARVSEHCREPCVPQLSEQNHVTFVLNETLSQD
jgi:hypothetical protein